MANRLRDIGVARQIGSYGDAVEVPAGARWLFTAGTRGLARDGALGREPPCVARNRSSGAV
jgi:2-iminobutanoate/2-iminopropanoate deaminase